MLIITPYQSIYLQEINLPTPVTSDLEVTGFETHNSSKVEAIANTFDFLENTINVTVFSNVGVNSVILLHDALTDNSRQSEVTLGSKGRFELTGFNIKYFSYIIEGNDTATLRFEGRSNSYLPDPLETIFDPVPIRNTASFEPLLSDWLDE